MHANCLCPKSANFSCRKNFLFYSMLSAAGSTTPACNLDSSPSLLCSDHFSTGSLSMGCCILMKNQNQLSTCLAKCLSWRFSPTQSSLGFFAYIEFYFIGNHLFISYLCIDNIPSIEGLTLWPFSRQRIKATTGHIAFHLASVPNIILCLCKQLSLSLAN